MAGKNKGYLETGPNKAPPREDKSMSGLKGDSVDKDATRSSTTKNMTGMGGRTA